MSGGHSILVCASCPAGQACLARQLAQALDAAGITGFAVQAGACMSGCARPSAVAFRAAGKTAYLFGDITAEDLPALVIFARLYAAAPDGDLADARPLGALRFKALARIPPG